MLDWTCPRCRARISGPKACEVSIAWTALWHVERAHVDGVPTDPREVQDDN